MGTKAFARRGLGIENEAASSGGHDRGQSGARLRGRCRRPERPGDQGGRSEHARAHVGRDGYGPVALKLFHERTLWPEFLALCDELHTHLDELTTRVIREAIDEDVSEPAQQAPPPKALPQAGGC